LNASPKNEKRLLYAAAFLFSLTLIARKGAFFTSIISYQSCAPEPAPFLAFFDFSRAFLVLPGPSRV
jgi:hypothetical protein